MTNKPRVVEKWGAAEEQRLAEMLERKRVFFEEHRPAVEKLAAELSTAVNALNSEVATKQLTQLLINNADNVRDVLAPFDTGVRATSVEKV